MENEYKLFCLLQDINEKLDRIVNIMNETRENRNELDEIRKVLREIKGNIINE